MTGTTYRASFDDYLRYVDAMAEANPHWRCGQVHYNALYRMRPDLAGKVRESAADPFHLDERLPAFIRYVQENW